MDALVLVHTANSKCTEAKETPALSSRLLLLLLLLKRKRKKAEDRRSS
jgi:hypothetical protein